MFGGLAIVFAVVPIVGMILAVYLLIRLAVRHGILDAHRRLDAERGRAEAGLGAERAPTTLP